MEQIFLQPCKSGYLGLIKARQPFFHKVVTFAPSGEKYEAIFRLNACFTRAYITDDIHDVPEETQNLLVFHKGIYTLYYFVAEGDCRCSFRGGSEPALVFETGDDSVFVTDAVAFFTISGPNLYQLFEEAAKILSKTFTGVKRLCEKLKPTFLNKIGFCTYNAFYDNVSEKNISALLEDLKKNNQKLGYIILDAGWQTVKKNYMSDFKADAVKFKNGLKMFKENMRKEYGISDVLVWHTFMGYWCGIYPESYRSYGIIEDSFDYGENTTLAAANCNCEIMNTTGEYFYPPNIRGEKVFLPENVQRWYEDFYSYLRENGISGSKVDAIGWIEVVNRHNGGRVKGCKKLVRAIAAASNRYFDSNSIYCSCNTNDFFFTSDKCSLIRTSSDYEPDKVTTHGEHIFSNAHAAMWFREFFVCDFDMFQTGREGGRFHAIHRAISGGPVYFTDNLESIDYNIIKSLCSEDGILPCFDGTAKLTTDCVFRKQEEGFIKLYNNNENQFALAVFNCVDSSHEESVFFDFLDENVTYAAYSCINGFMGWVKKGENIRLSIQGIDADLICFIPQNKHLAVIGEKGKFIPFGFVDAAYFDDHIEISCIEEGSVLIAVGQSMIIDGISYNANELICKSCKKNEKITLEVR